MDVLGPASAPFAVTARPSEGRAFGDLDTWFQDCSSATAADGTYFQANFINGLIAALRGVWRGNGLLADGITKVVPESGTNDGGVLTAIQHLIQRGQALYAEDTSGAVNVLAAALSPPPAEYKKGMVVWIKAANTNTGAATLNLNGLGGKAIVRGDGSSALVDSDIVAGQVQPYVYDGARFQLAAARAQPQLARNTTLYVNAAIGSDANDGTANIAGKALATIQGAINLAFKYGPSQYTISIIVADGTYGAVATPVVPGPPIVITGNVGSPGNVQIVGAAAHALALNGPNVMTIEGVKVSTGTGGSPPYCGFVSTQAAFLTTRNTASGNCQGGVFETTQGTLNVGSHTFGGNSQYLWWSSFGSQITLGAGATFTLASPITVTTTAYAAQLAGITIQSPAPAFVNPSNVIGQRYAAGLNSVINTNIAGASYFPGTIDGAVATGGQYY